VVTHFETRKAGALLAYLAFYPDRRHPREVLAEMLWPDEDPEATRARLRQSLASLRRALEQTTDDALILSDGAGLQLNRECFSTDVMEFEDCLRRTGLAESPDERITLLSQAVDLYRGELLPGYYEEWIAPERERFLDQYIGALRRLADALSETGELNGAIDNARRAVAADPLREESHRYLMRLYARADRGSEIVRQYRELEALLRQELRTAPSPATQKLRDELLSMSAKAEETDTAVPAKAPAPSQEVPIPAAPVPASDRTLEPVGGAVPLNSPFYVERPTDARFRAALAAGDSIVLVKGARQVGKTSLLARSLQEARLTGARVALVDFQMLTTEQLSSTEALFLTIADLLVESLDLDIDPREVWKPGRGWNVNFQSFMRRQVLQRSDTHVVLALDEVDRLFSYPLASEVFALFRSWHNERALNPSVPWSRLTLAIAYATEAHLFITDLNQSPFNVGTRLTLEDFTLEQVGELNRRHGSPIQSETEVARFAGFLGGHPFLVRRGLHALASGDVACAVFEEQALNDDRLYGEHLRRLLLSLSEDTALGDAVRALLRNGTCPSAEAFLRLRSGGVLAGETAHEARPRCELYKRYLARHLG
jgi:DNA-binding SARP family transcriptional activator